MPLASTTAVNAALNGLAGVGVTNVIPFVSLHTSPGPGTNGANEYPGVVRQACNWNPASGGSMTNSSSMTFSTSGLLQVTSIGTWTQASAGSFSIGAPLSSSVTSASIVIAPGAVSIGAN